MVLTCHNDPNKIHPTYPIQSVVATHPSIYMCNARMAFHLCLISSKFIQGHPISHRLIIICPGKKEFVKPSSYVNEISISRHTHMLMKALMLMSTWS